MSDIDRRWHTAMRILGGSPGGVLVRLLITSLVVGIILRAGGVDFDDLVLWVEARIRDLSELSLGTLRQIGEILLLGALVVVPVWAVLRVIRVLTHGREWDMRAATRVALQERAAFGRLRRRSPSGRRALRNPSGDRQLSHR